jgi:hypothetical protein
MLTLRAPLKPGTFKALTGDDDPPGTFEAVVAVFNNVDLYGELVQPGCFEEAFKAGDWPKLVWSHCWNQPPIGVTIDIREAPELGGVYAKGRLFVDAGAGEDNELARSVWTALKAVGGDGEPGLDEFSYHYSPIEGGIEDREIAPGVTERIYVMRKASMTEWGPCLKGVNPETELLTVKADTGERMSPLAERAKFLPGYDPEQITVMKGNPQPNSTEDDEPEVDEEAEARTRKALLDLHLA